MTMGEKMQKLRKQKNWSQETLAEKLGVSRQAVSLWERGESMPEIDKLIPLARLFGVTADYLLDDTQETLGEKPQPTVLHQRPENPHFVQAFPLATLLDCAGLLCSALLWRQFQTLLSLLPGLLLQLLALTIALALRGFSRVPDRTQHWRRWLRHNLWVLLPIPILWGSSLLFSILPFSYWGPAPFIAALICYLVVVPLSVRQLH